MEPTQWLLCPILCPGEYFMFCPAGPRPGHWSHGMSRARVIPPGIVRRSMNSSSDCISVIADDRPQLQSIELVLSLVSYFESNSDIALMFQDYSWRKKTRRNSSFRIIKAVYFSLPCESTLSSLSSRVKGLVKILVNDSNYETVKEDSDGL